MADFVLYSMFLIPILIILIYSSDCANSEQTNSTTISQSSNGQQNYYSIEGKVILSNDLDSTRMSLAQWLTKTKIMVNYGEYYAFLRADGTFEVTNLPPGSYLVEVSNPDYFYEPVRVDINSKGKMRARKVNYIQTSAVQQLPYPLKFKAKGPFKYFQVRETWKITDFLLNPMVIMMVLPLLFIMVLPKMINADAETQRELQNMQMPKVEVPDLSEVVTSFFQAGKSQNVKGKQTTKKKQ